MIEHLPKETEAVREMLLRMSQEFSSETHKAISDFVLGEQDKAAGFVSVLAPKIIEMLKNAKAAASLPAFLAKDNIYDENRVPTILYRQEGDQAVLWGELGEILDGQAIDLYCNRDPGEEGGPLAKALDGLSSIRIRKAFIAMLTCTILPESIEEVIFSQEVDTLTPFKIAGAQDIVCKCLKKNLGGFSGGGVNDVNIPDRIADTWGVGTLDLKETGVKVRDFQIPVRNPYDGIIEGYEWKQLSGWGAILCEDAKIVYDSDKKGYFRKEY